MIVSVGPQSRRCSFALFMHGHDFFLSSHLNPAHTGLPFVVWITLRQEDCTDARIWISQSAKTSPSEFMTVSICPDVRVIEGQITDSDLALLRRWIELNRRVIEAHWRGEIEWSEEAMDAIRHIPAVKV
jgi:hypothetical protein